MSSYWAFHSSKRWRPFDALTLLVGWQEGPLACNRFHCSSYWRFYGRPSCHLAFPGVCLHFHGHFLLVTLEEGCHASHQPSDASTPGLTWSDLWKNSPVKQNVKWKQIMEVAVMKAGSLKHVAPCGLRGCKNGPAPFPGRMSYKATKPGLVSVVYLSMFFIVLVFIRAPFYYC